MGYRQGVGPNRLPQREELAWAAGFYDGEGCTTLRHHQTRPGRRPVVRLSIKQVERGPLDRFREAVGGIGAVYGPYLHGLRQDGSRKWIYTYSTSTWRESQAVIAMLWTFLSEPKREQAHGAFTTMREHPKWLAWKHVTPESKRVWKQAYQRRYYLNTKWQWGT